MKMLHPKAQDAADYGIKLPEGAPESEGVVYYKGSVNKNMAFSQELVTPQADEAPIKIMRYDTVKK